MIFPDFLKYLSFSIDFPWMKIKFPDTPWIPWIGGNPAQASHSKFNNFFYEFMTHLAEVLGHFGTLFIDFYDTAYIIHLVSWIFLQLSVQDFTVKTPLNNNQILEY